MANNDGITRELATAWIVTVINPILDGLRDEEMVLENRRTTWCAGPDRCELLRPCRDYIRSTYLPNFDDLIEESPGVRSLVERHDEAVVKLHGRLREASDAIRAAPEFQALCKDAESEPSLLVDAVVDDLSEARDFIASKRDLRHRRLWEEHGPRIRAVRALGPIAEALKAAGEALDGLLAATRALRTGLEDQRRALRKRFGIPSVPIGAMEPTPGSTPS